MNRKCYCFCGREATNQAVYRYYDGRHFLGTPVCDLHRYPLGKLNRRHEIIDYMEIDVDVQ